MTHKNIDWSKLDKMIEKSSNVVKDHTRIKEIDEEIEKIKKDGCKEYKKRIRNDISNLKGHISKDMILDIISK